MRFSIRKIFPGNIEERNERNSNKTVKPADETEAIADVIIREKRLPPGSDAFLNDPFASQLEEKKTIFAMDPGAGRAPGNPVGPCLIKQSKNYV